MAGEPAAAVPSKVRLPPTPGPGAIPVSALAARDTDPVVLEIFWVAPLSVLTCADCNARLPALVRFSNPDPCARMSPVAVNPTPPNPARYLFPAPRFNWPEPF